MYPFSLSLLIIKSKWYLNLKSIESLKNSGIRGKTIAPQKILFIPNVCNIHFECRKYNPELLWLCFTTVWDWSRKLALTPSTNQKLNWNQTNCFKQLAHFQFDLSLAPYGIPFVDFGFSLVTLNRRLLFLWRYVKFSTVFVSTWHQFAEMFALFTRDLHTFL